MIVPHEKVSWLDGCHRYWGFVKGIIHRQPYVVALVEHQGKYIEMPLEQLKAERGQYAGLEVYEYTGAELIHEARVDYKAFSDYEEPFEEWFPEVEWIDKSKRYRCNAQLENIEEI